MKPIFYDFKPLDREIVEKSSDEVAKYTLVQFFNQSMPDFHKGASELLGNFAKHFEETDPDIAEYLNQITLSQENVINIFDDFIGRINNDSSETVDGISDKLYPADNKENVSGVSGGLGTGSGKSMAGTAEEIPES